MSDDFDAKWIKVMRGYEERCKNDKSLEELIKKHNDYRKRLAKIQGNISIRHSQILKEEVKKVFST